MEAHRSVLYLFSKTDIQTNLDHTVVFFKYLAPDNALYSLTNAIAVHGFLDFNAWNKNANQN